MICSEAMWECPVVPTHRVPMRDLQADEVPVITCPESNPDGSVCGQRLYRRWWVGWEDETPETRLLAFDHSLTLSGTSPFPRVA